MIRPATAADLDAITAALAPLVAAMNDAGNDQWGPGYPLRSDFQQDLDEGTLFVDEEAGQIRGFAVLNGTEAPGYERLPWTVDRPTLVVHRLAVVPGFHRRGVADALFTFAEARAQLLGMAGLMSDTADVNTAMNDLFAKRGWRPVGPLRFDDATVGFIGWEKGL